MNTGLFPPAKRAGIVFHGSVLLILGVLSAWSFWRLSMVDIGQQFMLYLLLGLISFAPLPILAYRAYALLRAEYRLDRDTLELRWGLRDEVIPLTDIEWVRSAQDLSHPISLPALPMPGAILGLRRHRDLGIVEFLASRAKALILVATAKRIYAISPAEPAEFVATFARAVELGSLREATPKSVYASFVFSTAWQSGWVRYLWLVALFLNIGLVAWISMLIPSSHEYALGFRPDRTPDAVPSVQLIILPLVSAFLSLAGWTTGLFFYRWEKWKSLALVLWASGALSSLLFLIAVLFIVTTPV